MPNPAHLDKLCEGPKAWNTWREDNPNLVPDLTEIKLSLSQRQLGPSTGGPIDLSAADLERASLPYATLTGANLEGARLVGTDMTHARLDGANLAGADLTDAILDQADLMGANLDQAVLFGADLTNTRNLSAPQLEAAFGDTSTKLPGNLLPPESWLPAPEYDDEDDYTGWGMPANEPVEQTLYEVLGLSEKASAEEIRTSYRNLVKKLHPDLNPNDEEAQERFKRVTTAYRILNDSTQRERYDRGEIDGEGKVNPEYEARQRFRKTAVRYYSAAAASFVLAVVALGAVWYTVLSVDDTEAPQEVAVVSPPKRGERLNSVTQQPSAPAPAQTPERSAPQEEQEDPEPETPSSSVVEGKGSPVEAATSDALAEHNTDQPPPSEQDGSPLELKSVEVAPAVEQPTQNDVAATVPAAQPAPAPATPSNAPEQQAAVQPIAPTSPPPAAAPAEGAKQAVEPDKAAPPGQAEQQTALNTQREGNQIRPLWIRHNHTAGQTAQFAPEQSSLAAIQQGGRPPRKDAGGPVTSAFAVRGESVPPAQRRKASGAATRLLSIRAVGQAPRRESRPFTASGTPGSPESKRTVSVGDGPTGAIPAKPRPATAPIQKRTSAPQSAQQQARNPQANGMAPKSQAPRNASAAEAATKRQQQQAVSDIMAGGF